VPGTIRSVLQSERPILRSNGLYTRDYIFVDDVVSAYMATAEALGREEIGGQAFNFSPESRVSVLEITRLVLKLMGRDDLEPVILDQVTAEIKDQYLDASKARRMLGWAPRFTLEQGLAETIRWYRAFLGQRPVAEPVG